MEDNYDLVTSWIEEFPKNRPLLNHAHFIFFTLKYSWGEKRKSWSKPIYWPQHFFLAVSKYFLPSNGVGPSVFMVFNRKSVIIILTAPARILMGPLNLRESRCIPGWVTGKLTWSGRPGEPLLPGGWKTIAWMIVGHLGWVEERDGGGRSNRRGRRGNKRFSLVAERERDGLRRVGRGP